METSGLDSKVDVAAINGWIEFCHARRFPCMFAEAGNDWIAELIRRGEPAAIGKIGDRECCALSAYLGLRQFYKYTWTSPSFGEADLCRQAGVFPAGEKSSREFAKVFLSRLSYLDGCAVWHNPGESQILAKYAPSTRRFALTSLDPYLYARPWSAELAGKRVLVVHPFEESMRSQFARRKMLWPDRPAVLPEFELDIIRSPYGFSRNAFDDWSEMLRWMESQIEERFKRKKRDVVLLGCGAAGLPLAALVKSLGAIGIHLGGPTQILFGIRGGRWDQKLEFKRFLNEAWVRPLPHETPPEAKTVDNGGYW